MRGQRKCRPASLSSSFFSHLIYANSVNFRIFLSLTIIAPEHTRHDMMFDDEIYVWEIFASSSLLSHDEIEPRWDMKYAIKVSCETAENLCSWNHKFNFNCISCWYTALVDWALNAVETESLALKAQFTHFIRCRISQLCLLKLNGSRMNWDVIKWLEGGRVDESYAAVQGVIWLWNSYIDKFISSLDNIETCQF